MSDINDSAAAEAAKNASVRLGPTGEPKQSSAIAMRFPAAGAWAAGNYFSIVADSAFYLKCGDNTVAATTADTGPFPAGVHDFALPNACTHVSLVAVSGTLVATVWKS